MSGIALPKVIAADANFLVAAICPSPSSDDELRAAIVLQHVNKARGQLVIPMPALAEYLVRAEAASLPILEKLERSAFVNVAPFDRAAAFECAQMDAAALGRGDKKDNVDAVWQKVKVDRQVIAIAKSCGAQLVISGDAGVAACAARAGISSCTLDEIALPPAQRPLGLSTTPPSATVIPLKNPNHKV